MNNEYPNLPRYITKSFSKLKDGTWKVHYRVRLKTQFKTYDKSFDNLGKAIGYLEFIQNINGDKK